MTWKNILKEEEELPEDVKRARERVKQGLPSIEQPLIPQFDDEKRMKKAERESNTFSSQKEYESFMKDRANKNVEEATKQIREAFEGIDHVLLLSVLNPKNANEAIRPSMTQKELVDMLTKEVIKRLKTDRLYR